MKIDITDRRNIYFVGDLHGDWKALQFFLKRVQFTYRDVIIGVGDLIDRGADSFKVAQFFLLTPNAYTVRGNHESMAIRGVKHNDMHEYACWMNNHGDWAIELPNPMLRAFVDQLAELPRALTVQFENTKFGIVHAEAPTQYWDDYIQRMGTYYPEDQAAMWDRNAIKGRKFQKIDGVDWVISGHSVCEDVTRVGNQLWIDTGSVFDTGRDKYGLTILEWDKEDKGFLTHRVQRDDYEMGGLRHDILETLID